MGRAGILDHRERLELIDGAIYVMSPIGRRHAACVDWINAAFFESGGLAGRALVRVQNPMAESEHSEPQPDLMLLAERSDRYADGHPAPEEVLLLVEVADSTLAFDRRTKIPLYAADGIREVWLVDLVHDRIEVYTDPAPHGYQAMRRVERTESIAPEALPDVRLAADRIIPPRPARPMNPGAPG